MKVIAILLAAVGVYAHERDDISHAHAYNYLSKHVGK